MNTDQTIDEPCYVCDERIGDDDRDAAHWYHATDCARRRIGVEECDCDLQGVTVHEACCPECRPASPVEVNRKRRGHGFYPPASALADVPALYEAEDVKAPAKVLGLHYFVGSCDWWLAGVDPESWRAFGYVCLGDPQMAEWGYVDLAELEAVALTPNGFPVVVERDLYWTPRTAKEAKLPGSPCREARGQGRRGPASQPSGGDRRRDASSIATAG